jgi:hypothetical protein
MNHRLCNYTLPHEYLERIFCKEEAKPKKINHHISPKLWVYLKKVDISKLSPVAMEMFTLTEARKRKHEVKKIMGLTESMYVQTKADILEAAGYDITRPEASQHRNYLYVHEILFTKDQIKQLSPGAAMYYNAIHKGMSTRQIRYECNMSPYWMEKHRAEIRELNAKLCQLSD